MRSAHRATLPRSKHLLTSNLAAHDFQNQNFSEMMCIVLSIYGATHLGKVGLVGSL